MKTKFLGTALIISSLSLVAGCSTETTSSANIRTAGIAALIDVTSTNGTSSTVRAELRVGGDESNTFVVLDNGDRLTAAVGDDSKSMHAQSEGVYEAEFSTAAAGDEFKVMFDREEDEDAPGSSGIMPAPFQITGVPDTSPSRENEDITITWDPPESGSNMKIEIDGSCIFSETIDVPGDSGSHTISADTLSSTGGSDPETCDLEVEITRSASGTADSAFDNESWFRLYQRRKATFTSAP